MTDVMQSTAVLSSNHKALWTPPHRVNGQRSEVWLHLNALGPEDELGEQRGDVGLVEDGVGDTLQEGLQGGHALHDHPLAEDAVLKEQEHHAWANLATQTQAQYVKETSRPACYWGGGVWSAWMSFAI